MYSSNPMTVRIERSAGLCLARLSSFLPTDIIFNLSKKWDSYTNPDENLIGSFFPGLVEVARLHPVTLQKCCIRAGIRGMGLLSLAAVRQQTLVSAMVGSANTIPPPLSAQRVYTFANNFTIKDREQLNYIFYLAHNLILSYQAVYLEWHSMECITPHSGVILGCWIGVACKIALQIVTIQLDRILLNYFKKW